LGVLDDIVDVHCTMMPNIVDTGNCRTFRRFNLSTIFVYLWKILIFLRLLRKN